MIYALDASALLAYLNGEAGASVVAALLSNPANRCYAHAINLCEIYYSTVRTVDTRTAQAVLDTLETDGVLLRRDISQPFWQQVGRWKARGRISLADCFCIALAQEVGGTVVTADRHEFAPYLLHTPFPHLFIR